LEASFVVDGASLSSMVTDVLGAVTSGGIDVDVLISGGIDIDVGRSVIEGPRSR